MIINHNMSALNAHRQLGANNGSVQKSLEKLSSGLKINRAGDDAAGLAISEKMRGQIKGLEMASKNAQDGISLIQTAEGALNETHSILQRMRELAVQSSNDTNNEQDRNEIQKEINQLTSEINRIGNTTEFNTKKLVNGDLTAKKELTAAETTNVTKAVTQSFSVGDEPVAWTNNSKADFDIKVTGKADNGLDWSTINTAKANTITVTKSGNDFKVDISAEDQGAKTLTVAADQMAYDAKTETYTYNGQGVSFSFSKADTANWADGGSVTVDLAKVGADVTQKELNTVPAKVQTVTTGTTGDAKGAFSEVKVDGAAANLPAGYNKAVVEWNETNNEMTVTLSGDGAETIVDTLSANAGDTVKYNNYGISFDFTGTGDTSGDGTVKATFNLKAETKAVETKAATHEDNSAVFQIGANEGQSIAVGIEDMRAAALGLTTAGNSETFGVTDGSSAKITEQALDVSTHDKATKAVTTIQKAIDKVSSERSKLGAVQNRLEHTINNLGTSAENLTAAESRIRDVDYDLAAA